MTVADALIKAPNVCGQFYAADADLLAAELQGYLAAAPEFSTKERIAAIFVPHAGYRYSGAVAAHAFKAIAQQRYRTIVILAPSHYQGFEGMAIWENGGFETPLGTVAVDTQFTQWLIDSHEGWESDAGPFLREHSIEVILPFLQTIFAAQSFRIVPVLIGQPSKEGIARFTERLDACIGEREDVLLVVSTDLSHDHDATLAQSLDQRTMALLINGDSEALWQAYEDQRIEMCGYAAAMIALSYTKNYRGKGVRCLQYQNSGHKQADQSRVVGYMAGVITTPRRPLAALTQTQQDCLLDCAFDAIFNHLSGTKVAPPLHADFRLDAPEGAFVTIYHRQRLHACIGVVIADTPLCHTVQSMAIAAAMQDARFSALTLADFPELEIEISVLSIPEQISSIDEFLMGQHGVLIQKGEKRGVFLPQVGRTTGWTKEEFLSKLCIQKAGLPASSWRESEADIQVFSSTVFSRKYQAKASTMDAV